MDAKYTAVVHLAPGMTATEEELRDWVAARLAKFKVPVRLTFIEDLLPRPFEFLVIARYDIQAV